MTVRSISQNVDAVASLHPAARNATGTGAVVDLQGYDAAMVVVGFGAITDGTHTPGLQHSDDGTAFTDAGTDSALQGTFAVGTATTVQRVGYLGNKRYVRAMVTVAGATTGALSDAKIVRGHAARKPV